MRVGIRADGCPDMGFGHLARTGGLAQELASRGHTVVYLTATPTHVHNFVPGPVSVVQLSNPGDGKECAEVVQLEALDVVVTDSYNVNTQYQILLSKIVDVLVVIQATAKYELSCDVLVNGHLFAQDVRYEYRGNEPTWCLGPDYLVLREEFNRIAGKQARWRDEPERALIIMGGGDVNNTTPAAVRAFDGHDLGIDVIVGPGYSNRDEIRNAVETTECAFTIHNEPSNLPELMFDADFAVSALGTTVYELIATNTPLLGLSSVENQNRIAQMVQQHDLGIVVDSLTELREGIENYVTDTRFRRTVFRQYRDLVDGKGTQRVVNSIEESNSVA